MYQKLYYSFLSDRDLIRKIQIDFENRDKLWHEFINRFSKLILKIIWQFENDYDAVMDKYLWICGKLCCNDFSVLNKFKIGPHEETPKFTTWLVAVIRNLCVDAHRMHHGRKRIPKALLNLSAVELKIFKLYYWKGYSIEEIDHMFNADNACEQIDIAGSIERIETLLGGKNALYKEEKYNFISMSGDLDLADRSWEENNDYSIETFERWIAQLSEDERLIVRLKFWENLSAKVIAQHLEIASEQKVYSILKNSLKKLRSMAEKEICN